MQDGEGDFRTRDVGSESFAMALAAFAEEDGFDAAAGAESFFSEANAFDAYGAGFCGGVLRAGRCGRLLASGCHGWLVCRGRLRRSGAEWVWCVWACIVEVSKDCG